MSVHDQYHGDPTLTKLLAYLEDRPEALSAVKHASFDPEVAQRLPASAFAWDAERRYPMHTREDTIASIAYRSKVASDMKVPSFVDTRLAQAAEAFGVKPELFRSTRMKVAAAPVEYALPDQERLPLGSKEQVKVAQEVLQRDGEHLPLSTRVAAYTKVASAALAHGMPYDNAVGVYAGLNSCNTQLLCDRLGMRAATTKVAACVTAYDTLDRAMRNMPPVISDRDTLMKLAERIEMLDRAADLDGQYGRKIFDPMKTVFNSGEKIAEAAPMMTRLMQLPAQVWEQVDVPEMAQIAASGDTAQFQQVYATLPQDIKMTLERQLGA